LNAVLVVYYAGELNLREPVWLLPMWLFFCGLVAVGNFTINSAELCKDLIQEKATQRYVKRIVTLLLRRELLRPCIL